MRNLMLLLLFLSGISLSVAQAEVYRWVDASGRVVYGDDPPKKSGAKAVQLPTLTIADGYAPKEAASQPAAVAEPAPAEVVADTDEAMVYSEFKITAPSTDETVRTNTGSLTATVTLTPNLKAGDGIVWYLDAKQVASGVTPTITLEDVPMGTHRIFAVLNDAAGNIIQNTETITFNLVRQASAPKT